MNATKPNQCKSKKVKQESGTSRKNEKEEDRNLPAEEVDVTHLVVACC